MTTNVRESSQTGFFQLAYVSSAVEPFSDAQLEILLTKSRKNNEACGITGLLLYKDGNFMQFLEGPKPAVIESMSRIKADSRHRGVIVLLQEYNQLRDFADWSMGFKKLGDVSADMPAGYSDFLDSPLTSEAFVANPAKSLKLLRSFRQSMR